MKSIEWLGSFRKDYKRILRRNYKIQRLDTVMDLLRAGTTLPASNRVHALHGEWIGYLECHVAPNWLLIYKTTTTKVSLARTGTHADLFE